MTVLPLVAALAAAGSLLASRPLVEGNRDSAVRVIVYEDLQCPDCANFRRMLDERLLPKYGASVAFEHRDFPLAKHAGNFPARLAAFAGKYGIDPAKAVAALDNPVYAAAVEKDFQEGVARGVAKTPTVLINGEPFVETFTFEDTPAGIEQALQAAK